MDELDIHAKFNKQVSLIYAVKDAVKSAFIYFGIILFFLLINTNELIVKIANQNRLYFTEILISIFIVQFIYKYKWMKNRLDLSSVLQETRKDNDPVLYMQNLKNDYQKRSDIAEKKLELLKSFSLFPLLTYFLNIYVYIDKNVYIETFTNIFSLSMAEILLILAVTSTILYAAFLRILYQEYKDNKDYLCKVETALMNQLRSEK